MSGHPHREALERFLLSDLPAVEMRDVLRHLLSGCPTCLEITAGCWGFDKPDHAGTVESDLELGAEYDQVLDRVFARIESYEAALARDRARARELFEELSRHPIARQRLLVCNSGRFRNPVLCDLLIEKSHEAVFQDPTHAIGLAEIAVAIAGGFGPAEGAASRNLEARAWAGLGNARRVASDLHGAEEALQRAEALLADGGSAGLLDRARVLDLMASLRISQRRFPEALRLLGRVQAIYQRLGQRHLLGRTLAQRAIVCGEAGDAETAIDLLRQALELLDPQEEPRMVLAARHNLILYLSEVGAHREAFTQLFHTRPLYLHIGDRIILLRLRAIEGKVAAGLGRLEQAEVAYKEVREAFVELGMDYDAAVVALELAAIYARERRSEDLRRLSEEMLPVFQSRSIHREALVALAMFRQAVEMEQAETGLIQEIGRFLRLVRSNPDLRFQQSQ